MTSTVDKLDLVRADPDYYRATAEPRLHHFGTHGYLTVAGRGEPAGEAFTAGVEALYPVAYGVRKITKTEDQDFAVPRLEALWWVEGDRPAAEVPRTEWHWRLLIRLPDFVTAATVDAARAAGRKGGPGGDDVGFERRTEGRAVQALHTGSYATEPETLARMTRFMADHDLVPDGPHHEVYLSDPRRTAPERLRTILRQPVRGR